MLFPSLNFHLGEEIDLLRDSVSAFAGAEIAPHAGEIDSSNEFPLPLWRKLGEMGLLGITVPEQYGGAGMGYLAHIVAMEEISRALSLGGSELRRPLQPVCQPDLPQRQRTPEGKIPASPDQRRANRCTGHVRARLRFGRGEHGPARRTQGAIITCSTATRCG